MNLFRSLKASKDMNDTIPSAIPDGRRVYAVGDIHGRADLLDEMLELIAQDLANYEDLYDVIFLGDFINRGPASAAVLDRLCGLAKASDRYRFIMGNHEEIFFKMLSGDADLGRMFDRMGGFSTLKSYGVNEEAYMALPYNEIGELAMSLVPAEHVNFMRQLRTQVTVGDYLFVHAGVDTSRPASEQDERVTRWIRDEFLHSEDRFEKTVVYGHTIYKNVEESVGRIGIDTGAYVSGKLTALVLEGATRSYLQTGFATRSRARVAM